MRKLGAHVESEDGGIDAYTGKEGLKGNMIKLPFPSVGATQNTLLAAMCAAGITTRRNASMEPEIWDLCDFLRLFGARIDGERTGTITVEPGTGEYRCEVEYTVPADRIVAGTILTAAAGCTGTVYIPNIECSRIGRVIK